MRELLDDCVHCGFCLPTCPTYLETGEEMESPRGRILLMDLLERGTLLLDDDVAGHLDSCLGCLACVTSCPSGVRYDRLIEETRGIVERDHRRPASDRGRRLALFALLPHAHRLRPAAYALAAARALHLPLPRLAPRITLGALRDRPPTRTAPAGERRATAVLALGCVARAFGDDVNAATARVLAAWGVEVLAPRDQGCCGALELHAGRVAGGPRRTALLDRLAATGADVIVTSTAGCGSALKDADHPAATRVRDVHELLIELGAPPALGRIEARVAYHDACHLAHGQGIRDAPRALLRAIPGIELVELDEPAICCGSAGTYNLLQAEMGRALGERKAASVSRAAPDMVAAANPGCLIQIAAHLDVEVVHPVVLLDRALAVGTTRF
jgi:glycolate oxidase iron-sulfur subunit